MITNLLPGFREFRVPLIVGYLWLVAVWVLFGPLIPEKSPPVGLFHSFYLLAGWLGTTIALTALTFVAYLAGLLLSQISFEGAMRWRKTPPLSKTTQAGLGSLIERKLKQARERGVRFEQVVNPGSRRSGNLNEYIKAQMWDRGDLKSQERYDSAAQRTRIEQDRWDWLQTGEGSSVVQDQVMDELELTELALQAANRDIYDKYDRTKAEAAFRRALAVPVLAVGVAVSARLWRDGFGWWSLVPLLAVVPAYFLEVSAFCRQVEANEFIVQAIVQGIVEAPALKLIDEATTETGGRPQAGSTGGSTTATLPV